MSGKKRASKSTWVDPDDAPELTEEWFAKADLYEGGKLIRKGGRPKSDNPKEAVNIRLDADLVAHYRASGPGWQSRMNDALRRSAKLPRKR